MSTRGIRRVWPLILLLAACGLVACEIITSTDEGKLIDEARETSDGGAPDGAADGDSGATGG